MLVNFRTMNISQDTKDSNLLGIIVEADINDHDKPKVTGRLEF